MIENAVCISAKADFLRGVHQPGDTYKIALYTEEASLGTDTTAYFPAGETTGSGYDAGGKILSGFAVSNHGGRAVLNFDTPVWNASTITAHGALIYNSTRGNRALASFDFGDEIKSTNGPFTAHMPAVASGDGPIVIE